MRTRIVIVILVILLLGAGSVATALGFFLLSVRTARETPNPLAVAMAESGKILLVPLDAAGTVNPVASSPEVLAAAHRTFTTRCAVCHGPDGKADTPIGAHIYPRAADLTAARTQGKSDGALFWLIDNGLPHTGMPGWHDLIPAHDIWGLVRYVRELPKGVPAAAAATPAPSSSGGAGATVTTNIVNYTFIPITVPRNTRVVWLNQDIEDHTVTSSENPPRFDSDTFAPGKSFEYTFTEPGTYNYFCRVHNGMTGVVIVQ